MIPAGERDQTIVIETCHNTTNALGEDVPTWIYHSAPFVKVLEARGREFLKGDYQAEERAAFGMTYREIDSTARVTWLGRIYRIENVTGKYRDNETWLHCITTDGAN